MGEAPRWARGGVSLPVQMPQAFVRVVEAFRRRDPD
jgi:hypothetical protein